MMTENEAIAWVRNHTDDDSPDDDELPEVFAALYGRPPDEQDRAEGLWSHCVAGIEK